MTNYPAAWRQKYPCEIVVFVDNEHESFLRIPCPPLQNVGLDDKFYLKYLYHVYILPEYEGGF
jgi:hypothetical protein